MRFILRLRLLAIIACGLLAAGSCPAQTLDERLLADAGDGRLEQFDFLAACLVASGVSDPAELAAMQTQHEKLRSMVDPDSLEHLAPVERLQELHNRLHGDVLTGDYERDASDLRMAIQSGNYNCLSALAIYFDLCREAQLDVQMWSRPGHVYLVSESTGERIEPGSPTWIDGPNHDPVGSGASVRQISPIQLLGKFYYNRGVLLLQQGRYADGLALLRTSLALDPHDREARGNLLAGLNNWAVALLREDRFADAERLIELGLQIDAGFEPLAANARYVQDRLAP